MVYKSTVCFHSNLLPIWAIILNWQLMFLIWPMHFPSSNDFICGRLCFFGTHFPMQRLQSVLVSNKINDSEKLMAAKIEYFELILR